MLTRMQKAYWQRVHTRAFEATRKFLGLESWGQIMLRALLGIAIVIGLAAWGSADAARDELIFRGIAIGMVVMLFPLVYAWNFAATPAKLDFEQQQKTTGALTDLTNLTIELAEKQAVQESVKLLGILLFEGEALKIQRITMDQLPEWRAELRMWGVTTMKFLATSFSQQDATRFNFIQYNPNNQFEYKVDDEHNRMLIQHARRLEILKDILDGYKDSWTTISKAERHRLESVLATIKLKIAASDSDQALKKENC